MKSRHPEQRAIAEEDTAVWQQSLLIGLLLLTVLVLCSCNYVPRPPRDGKAVNFKTIIVGSTTRDAVIQELGKPSATFEQKGILTYRIVHRPEYASPYVVPRRPGAGWVGVNYSLVLSFDSLGVLEQCSFAEVRGE